MNFLLKENGEFVPLRDLRTDAYPERTTCEAGRIPERDAELEMLIESHKEPSDGKTDVFTQ